MIDLDAVEARAAACAWALPDPGECHERAHASADDVPALVARVRELERKLAECDEETRLR